jgi:hypothetical protein
LYFLILLLQSLHPEHCRVLIPEVDQVEAPARLKHSYRIWRIVMLPLIMYEPRRLDQLLADRFANRIGRAVLQFVTSRKGSRDKGMMSNRRPLLTLENSDASFFAVHTGKSYEDRNSDSIVISHTEGVAGQWTPPSKSRYVKCKTRSPSLNFPELQPISVSTLIVNVSDVRNDGS